MSSRLIGGILLIVGTSIGAGMLALPVTTAPGGFLGATFLLLFCWLLMTAAALLILEVNLWLPPNTNLVSMAKRTLGRTGEIVAWVTYLLLLYSLLAAYISGGADVLHGIVAGITNIKISQRVMAILFLLLLGGVVYHGIKPIDYVNRVLMITKLAAFFLLVFLVAPHIHVDALGGLHAKALIPAITVAITSFGFASIVPSLRSYFNSDVKKLRLAILVGSAIPLICYVLWVGVILAEIPLSGPDGLIAMLHNPAPTTALVNSLGNVVNNNWILSSAHLFTSICVATSFLGVSLSLADFLADGFKVKKEGKGKVYVHLAAFLPPLILVLFYPAAFISLLSYAGIFCVILLVILPALMTWYGRYRLSIAGKYQLGGGKPVLALILFFAFLIIIQDILVSAHYIS